MTLNLKKVYFHGKPEGSEKIEAKTEKETTPILGLEKVYFHDKGAAKMAVPSVSTPKTGYEIPAFNNYMENVTLPKMKQQETMAKARASLADGTLSKPSTQPIGSGLNVQQSFQKSIADKTISPALPAMDQYTFATQAPGKKVAKALQGIEEFPENIYHATRAGLAEGAAGSFNAMVRKPLELAKVNASPTIDFFDAIAPGIRKKTQDKLIGLSDKILEGFESERDDHREAYMDNSGEFGKFIYGGVDNTAAMLPTMAVAVLSGGSTAPAALPALTSPSTAAAAISQLGNNLSKMVPFMTQAGGNYAREAELAGANTTQQVLYGVAGGLAEGLTESMAFPTLTSALGVGEEAMERLIKTGARNGIKQWGGQLLRWAENAVANIGQEVAVNPMVGMAERKIFNPNKPMTGEGGVFSASEAKESAKGAVAMSLVMAALGLPFNYRSHQRAREIIESGTMTNQQALELINTLSGEARRGVSESFGEELSFEAPAQQNPVSQPLQAPSGETSPAARINASAAKSESPKDVFYAPESGPAMRQPYAGLLPESKESVGALDPNQETVAPQHARESPYTASLNEVADPNAPNVHRLSYRNERGERVLLPEVKEIINRARDNLGTEIETNWDMPDWQAGKYENGKIVLNGNYVGESTDAALAIIKHELTHLIESSGQYQAFQDFILDYMSKSDVDLGAFRRGLASDYASRGKTLDSAAIDREIVATFVEGNLFDNVESINSLAKQNPSLFRNILNWIQKTIKKFRASDPEAKFLVEAEYKFQKALNSEGAPTNNVQYAISPSLKSQLDYWLKNFKMPGEYFDLGITPQALVKNGAEALPVVMSEDVLIKATGGKHSVSTDEIAKIPNQLADPILLMKGSVPNSFVVLTEMLDNANDSIVVAIHLDRLQKRMRVNRIASLYGKQNIESYIARQISEGNLLDASTEKSQSWFTNRGLQLPKLVQTMIGSNSNIAQGQTAVNSSIHNSPKDDSLSALNIRYAEMLEKYGAIKKGENPVRDVDIPQRTTDNNKVRKFVRTAAEADATPDAMVNDIKQAIVEDAFSYAPISNKELLNNAESTIAVKGFDRALTQWKGVSEGKGIATAEEIVLGELLYKEAAQAGNTKLAMEILAEVAVEGTRAGQMVQALRMLKKMTPEGRLYYIQKAIEKLNGDNKGKEKLEIDRALADELLNASTEQQMEAASDKILQSIADQMEVSWADKWNAWRYFAMLGNPRTHIRNLLGNAVFVPAVKLKNVIGAGLEASLIKEGERTKAILTRKDKGLMDFAKSDFANIQEQAADGGKLNPADAIREKRRIFSIGFLEWARTANFSALEAEDAIFLRRAYTEALASYMKANGYTPEYFRSQKGARVFNEARQYAIMEAQMATFRDANSMATMLNRLKNKNTFTKIAGEGLMPFTKTPLNILRRGVEYSPAGLMKGVYDMVTQVKSGKVSATQAINEMAAGMSGTMIFALGAWLASMGLISGGDEGDKKEAAYEAMLGEQNYALNIGDYTYTIDWIAPVALPLFIGVETYNSFKEGNGIKNLSRFFDNMTRISEPMFNLSVLQGLDSAIKAIRYGDVPMVDFFANAAGSYVTQGVPTVLGQIARTVDGTRRSTSYMDPDSTLPKGVDRTINKTLAKIPGASKTLPAYIDQWGREDTDDNLARRAFENFISPGYISKDKTTEVDRVIREVYEESGDKSVLPGYAAKTITIRKEERTLTPQQYERFSQQRGVVAYNTLRQVVTSNSFKTLEPSDQVAVVAKTYTYAGAIASRGIFPEYQLDGWMRNAQRIETGGISFGDQMIARTLISKAVGEPDDYGNTISGSKKQNAIDLIAKEMKVAPTRARLMYEMLKSYVYAVRDLDTSGQKRLKEAKVYGYTENQFLKAYNAIKLADARHYANGETIPGSLKKSQREMLMAVGFTQPQAARLLNILTKDLK